MEFSVLMSVYKNENPDWFKEAIESVLNNTVVPNQIVLVRDGEVPAKLQEQIDFFLNRYPELFTYLPFKENRGLGNALNSGLAECRYELVARMDTDDISAQNRFELQVKAFEENSRLDMVGGQMTEFIDDPENIVGTRIVPQGFSEIKEYLKSRSAFNHVTVMFKKSAVIAAGGYIEMRYVEDYFLWLRMMLNDAEFINIPDVLANVRTNHDTYKRRGGYEYFKVLK